MNSNLLIIGAGMYGWVVKETALATGDFHKVSFVDDNTMRDDVIGRTEDIEKLYGEYKYAVVAIGNPEIRRKYFSVLENVGYTIPVLIHPKAYVSPTADIKPGCVIEPMSVVHSNASLEKGCLICAGSVINHNAHINEFCQIDCNATIGAGVEVESDTKVTSGSFRRKN